jgi:hypothetical protein
MGLNVTIFMREMVVKYVRLKCNYRTKCHSMGRHETSGKNVTEWMFCHNPDKNGWSNCHSYITSTLGLGGRKILGRFVWRRYVTVDVVNRRTLRWVDVPGSRNFTRTFQAWTFRQGTV